MSEEDETALENARPPSRLAFLLYDLTLCIAGLIAAPWLLLRLATRARYREGLAERLGLRLPPHRGERQRVWIHAASAGEMVAALALLERLAAKHPEYGFVLSSTTTSGLQVANRHGGLASECSRFLLPLDLGICVRRVLDRVDPRMIVLVELELWPNLVAEAGRRSIPLVVANGRVSERSARRYRWPIVSSLVGFRRVAGFAVQNEEIAAHVRALGVPEDRIAVTGNMKIDRPTPGAADRERIRASLGVASQASGRRVGLVVAGSTHRGEEAALARASKRLEAEGLLVRWMIAPRHRERLAEAERDLVENGLDPVRLSALRGGNGVFGVGTALVVDTMGELASLYAAADVAYVGGSLFPGVGGHNVFEPVMAGAPAIVGPYLKNVRADAQYLEGCGALRVAADENELVVALKDMLRDDASRYREATHAAVARARGAADRTVEFIESRLLRSPAVKARVLKG